MDVYYLVVYTLLGTIAILILMIKRQNSLLENQNPQKKGNCRECEEAKAKLEEENKRLKEEIEELKKQNQELKEHNETVSGLLSQEQKARLEAEEKAKQEELIRLEDTENAKRAYEALEVESQMAVIVAQEKAKKAALKLQQEAEEKERRLREEAEEKERRLKEEAEEKERKIKEEAEEKERKLKEESEEKEKRILEEAEERERRLQEEAERKLEEEKAKWTNAVSVASKKIADLSFGKIRAVNNLDLDQLINVHGKHRPIAVYVKPRSSNLSHSGAFIYDTHKVPKDNSLYLFVGRDCPPALEGLGEKLLEAFKLEYPDANLIRIIRTTEGPDFQRMIKVIGGHIDQIQPSAKAGDELFFENNFFAVKLHLIIYSHGDMSTPELKTISLDDLPEEGAAVIDTSDTALYLYIPHSNPINDVEKADQEKCIKWLSEERDYSGRDVTIFNKTCIPPNLKVLFNIV